MVRSLLLGAILALSLGANAQFGGGPGGGGGGPGGGGGGQGQGGGPGGGGGGQGGGGQQQAPPPCGDPTDINGGCYQPPPVGLICKLNVNNNLSDISNYVDPKAPNLATEIVNGKPTPVLRKPRFDDYYLIQPVCNMSGGDPRDNHADIESHFSVSLPKCSDQSQMDGFCWEDSRLKANPIQSVSFVTNSVNPADKTTKFKKPYYPFEQLTNSQILVQYRGNKTAVLKDQVKFFAKVEGGNSYPDNKLAEFSVSLNREIKVEQEADSSATCRVIVSGAVDTSVPQVENALIEVTNGVIEFRSVIENASGDGARIDSVQWQGGPTQDGRWTNPPPNQISTVSANVVNKKGQQMRCSLRVKPQAAGFTVKLNKFGDCAFFTELRNYYYLDINNKSFQTDPFQPTIKYPGIDAQYGQSAPEVPFAGIMNAGAALNGAIVAGLNGAITLPPASNRRYSKAVLVAKVFDPKRQTVGTDPIYWGVLDLSNYANTRLIPTEEADGVKDSDVIVFQLFLAGSQPNAATDLRGQEGQIAMYDFIPAGEGGRPFDKIVPFMNETCIPMFQISMPIRQGKPLTSALKSAVSCTYSRPYKFEDLKAGRVNLTALHLVPEHAQHQFPTDLLKSSFQPPCVASNPADVKSCWDVKASQIGQSSKEDPFTSHESCRTTEVVGYETCDRYGCYKASAPQTVCKRAGRRQVCVSVKTPVTKVSYKSSCNVIESANECSSNLAVRFSGYNQMSVAALGCAVKYDRSGQVVTATLGPINQSKGPFNGIIPYTAFGGSPPKDYRDYPSSLMNKVGGSVAGYACIPCRFGLEEAAAGNDIFSNTGALPVDQDATTARKPIFSFNKLTAPRECVRRISMEVRYFGSSACDGVNAPPGHFCSSENISQQSCPTRDTTGDYTGGGNIAGKFSIDVCPGSGFEYDSVSVSWSPILVDTSGTGIQVSRDFQHAVKFDIKGNGQKSIIDWPMNTREVAFLVRANKHQKVESIKELFGDYKAKNGFEALRPYDTNRDGTIDLKDKRTSELSLWYDYNRNAVVDEGEIVSFEEAGVESISLNYSKPLNKGIEGKTLSAIYFNRKANRFMNVEDHYFYEYLKNGKLIDKKPAKKPRK